MRPFFSVILPVYNVAPWLRAALRSLQAQTFTDWECIAVDDGSRDGSAQLLQAFMREDLRFKVIAQPNHGVSAARNRALEAARGEYVCFMDGDDVVYPWWLAAYHEMITQYDADLVRGGFRGYPPYCLVRSAQPPKLHVYDTPRAVWQWGWTTLCKDGYSCLFAVRRAAIGSLRFPESIGFKEDVLFDLTLLPRLRRAVQSDEVGYWYRRRTASATHRRHGAEETLQRIARFVRIYEAQRETLSCAEISMSQSVAHFLLEETIDMIENGGSQKLPTCARRLAERNVLDLSALPQPWRQLLTWSAKGWVLPMAFCVWVRYLRWRILHEVNSFRRFIIDRMWHKGCYSFGEDATCQ